MFRSIYTPGRVELSGNHTDHQKGRILASAIDLGMTAQCEPNGSKVIHIQSEGFKSFDVRIDQLTSRPSEFGTSGAMVRGVTAAFRNLGLSTGGFNATIKSNLPVGSGLSSSAAFSVLVGKIFNELFNGGEVDPLVIARAGLEAENKYFGKPCGIMSQLACSLGHTVYADMKTGRIERVHASFDSMGLVMCLTNTGGSHTGLNTSYARIPADMVYIANYFDKGVLGDVEPEAFRSKGWDPANRPVRRAMHFFDENDRVPLMRDALVSGNGEEYMRLMNESGRSSEELLNNIVTSATGDTQLQSGLELSRKLLEGKGAWRVHGGGFAGCVQALMPEDCFVTYKTEMEKVFGASSCRKINLV